VLLFSFAAFIVLPIYIFFFRLPLEALDSGCGVISLVSAFLQRAGQHEFIGRRRPVFLSSVAAVNRKQDGYVALLTANREIPPRIDPGPSGNIHRVALFRCDAATSQRQPLLTAIAKVASVISVQSRLLRVRELPETSVPSPVCNPRDQIDLRKVTGWKCSRCPIGNSGCSASPP